MTPARPRPAAADPRWAARPVVRRPGAVPTEDLRALLPDLLPEAVAVEPGQEPS